MAEYIPYRILVDTSDSKINLNKELIKAVPPEYSIPSYIPPRIVEIYDFLPTYINSRVATYYLTDEEARTLTQDERILEILPLEDLTEDTGSFLRANYSRLTDKSLLPDGNLSAVNWGLYSCTHYDIPIDSLPGIRNDQGQEIANFLDFKKPYDYTLDGTGVDLIIIDKGAKINPFHQDFYDYTGTYSRVQTINWGEHVGWDPNDFPEYLRSKIFSASYHYYESELEVWESLGYLPEGYTSPGDDSPTIHGIYCLSIAGGRIYGWAKNANLYYIRSFDASYEFDLIRAFHESKSIDPTTGYKRPTIVNRSLGTRKSQPLSSELGTFYSGSFYPETTTQTLNIGIPTGGPLGNRIASIDVPLTEMTDSGVIFIHSSMNDGQIFFRASPGIETDYPIPDRYKSIHFNNYFSSSTYVGSTSLIVQNAPDHLKGSSQNGKYYYNRGNSPSNLATVEVGALSRFPLYNSLSASLVTNEESPDWYSNHGGGIDIYAPTEVMAAAFIQFYSSSFFHNPPTPPYSYISEDLTVTHGYIATPLGTSFAAPQVAGVACLYFQMNPGADVWQFKQFLLDHAKPVKIPPSEDNGGPIDVWAEGNVKTEGGVEYIALNGAPTASLFWPYSSPNKSTGLPVFTK